MKEETNKQINPQQFLKKRVGKAGGPEPQRAAARQDRLGCRRKCCYMKLKDSAGEGSRKDTCCANVSTPTSETSHFQHFPSSGTQTTTVSAM